MTRSIGSGTISFGLVSIPFKLYTAASSEGVSFNMLHPACGSRVRQNLRCPVCEVEVQRNETVKGYEYAKDQFVQFTDDEVKALAAERTDTLDLVEFVPAETVDLLHVEKSYYLGPDKGGAKAYGLLARALEESGKVAVGRHWMRGKQNLVLVRPYRGGLLMHHLYYATEVRDWNEIDKDESSNFRDEEIDLAVHLIEQLSAERFVPEQYKDEYVERVQVAVSQKVAGEAFQAAPATPRPAVIDLMAALKASLAAAPAAPTVQGEATTPEQDQHEDEERRPRRMTRRRRKVA